MPGFVRSLLISFAVTLFSFLCLSAWYWTQLRQPAPEYLRLLQRAMPAVEQLLERQQDDKAGALLDHLPFQVVVSESTGQALSSNLATGVRARRDAGQQALDRNLLQRSQITDQGTIFHYELPARWVDPMLLFPLCFSLLLGLLAGLWDLLQRNRQEDQTDALLMLSHLPGVAHHEAQTHEGPDHAHDQELASRLASLERQNQSLQAALQKARQWAPAAPDAETRAREQQLRALEARLGEQEAQLQKARLVEKHLVDQKLELETQLQQLRQQAQQAESDKREQAKKADALAQELTLAHQDGARARKDLEIARARTDVLEGQIGQLHEAWQEISVLRGTQADLLQREEAWKKEKQRVLALMHEKEEALAHSREQLRHAREKIHALSVAYKKQLELSDNLPQDLEHARSVLEAILAEKDRIEHENVEAQIELADRNSEVSRLRKELEVRASRLLEAQALIEELGDSLRSHERELGLVSETLSDKLLDLDRLKDLHDDKVQVLELTTQERDDLRQRLADQVEEIEALRQTRERLIHEHEQLQEQLAQIDVAAYELEIAQLRQSLQLTGQQQQRRGQALEQLKSKLREGEDLYARLKRHAETQELEIRSLQQQVLVYRSEIGLLQGKLSQQDDSPALQTGF